MLLAIILLFGYFSLQPNEARVLILFGAYRGTVHNAVGMVHMALRELNEQHVVKLDEERRAAMVSNLLVVLGGTTEATPVINTGTLYS